MTNLKTIWHGSIEYVAPGPIGYTKTSTTDTKSRTNKGK
jgi:hypothetical protein